MVTCCSEVLEELDVSWCRGITGAALGMLADSCPRLRLLRLFGCTQVCACARTLCCSHLCTSGHGMHGKSRPAVAAAYSRISPAACAGQQGSALGPQQ